MNYGDSIHSDVESLALQKAFAELTPEERTAVLRELGSADAYTSLRSMVLKVRSELAADAPLLQPRAASRDSLRMMVEGRAQRNRPLLLADKCRAAMKRRIPLSYSAAAVVAAVAATLFLYRPSEPAPVQKIVYVERPVAVPQPIAQADIAAPVQPAVDSAVRKAVDGVRRHTGTRPAPVGAVIRDTALRAVASVANTVATTLPGAPRNEYIGLGNLPQLNVQARGRTLAEDSSLSRLVRPLSLSDDTL